MKIICRNFNSKRKQKQRKKS